MYVYDKANELAKALAESSEYKTLKVIKEKLEVNPTNKNMVADFKKKQFELQTAQMMGEKLDEAKLGQLQSLYQVIMLNPDIAEYLAAELRFSQMMADIYKILGKAVELDMDFLEP